MVIGEHNKKKKWNWKKLKRAILERVILKYATTHNHRQPSTTTHNHLQPPTTTQVSPKNAKTCHKQLCYCILDVNTETDIGFDSDIKQWYIYMRMCVCAYVL